MSYRQMNLYEIILKNKIEEILKEKFSAKPKDIDIVFDKNGPKYQKSYISLHTSENDFCRFIYQYSHEYTHHIFEHFHPSKSFIDFHYDWFEGVICEAISLWMLKTLSLDFNFWDIIKETDFLKYIPLYIKKSIEEYNKNDSYIEKCYAFHRAPGGERSERPLLKMSVDLFNELCSNEEVWLKIINYNAIANPQPTVRPVWLKELVGV